MIGKTNGLVILDWDDSIFPTTSVFSSPNPQLAQLAELEASMITFLDKILSFPGIKVMIVTNAERAWVFHSAKRYMPALLRYLENPIPVRSARDEYSLFLPKHDNLWKVCVFKEIVAPQHTHVTQIGDLMRDRNALKDAMKSHRGYFKSVKLKEKPTAIMMCKQIQTLTNAIEQIVCCNDHVDLMTNVVYFDQCS